MIYHNHNISLSPTLLTVIHIVKLEEYEEICGREQIMKDVIKQGVFSAIISVKKLVLQGRLEERNVTFLDM